MPRDEPCGVIETELASLYNPLVAAFMGCPGPCSPPRVRGPDCLAWIPTIQCKDAKWSTNTVCRDNCAPIVPTCRIVVGLRNGVPCRCDCRPGECRGKLGTFNVERGHRP